MEVITTIPVRVLPDGRLLAQEAAKYIGLSPKTLAQMRCQGRGPRFIKRAGRVFYRIDDLRRWIETGDDCSPARVRVDPVAP